MDMEKLSFDKVNRQKINHQLELENKFTTWKPNKKGNKQCYPILYSMVQRGI
jgi:hypothetical protein